jgi:hypothetical protein
MRKVREPACSRKVLAAVLGVVGLALPWNRASLGLPQGPPRPGGSAFSKHLPTGFRWPGSGDRLGLRLLEEYGAIFLARGVSIPPVVIFANEEAVAGWQKGLNTQQVQLAGLAVKLQSTAMKALLDARREALQTHLDISPVALNSARRSYEETVMLWKSRVDPGLRHWVTKGLLSATEAARIRSLPAREQTLAILDLEQRGLYCSNGFSKSILFSVAPPGASQHLALLAFDVRQHDNSRVRSILERHGWFQTVRSDLPHFTYLGVKKEELPSLGLKLIQAGGREFWVPDMRSGVP